MCYNLFLSEKHLHARECAKILKIAHDTGCDVKVIANHREGSSKSIISLLRLMLSPHQLGVFVISGGDEQKAYHRLKNVFSL